MVLRMDEDGFSASHERVLIMYHEQIETVYNKANSKIVSRKHQTANSKQ
jgi:hypothetical protein